MRGLVSNYAFSLKLAFYIAVVFGVVAAVVVLRSGNARDATRSVSRVLAVGSVLVIFVATGLPRDWPLHWGSGDLEPIPGRGGFSWRVLVHEPNTLASLLMVLNVALYIPLGFFGTLGWRRHPGRALAVCVCVSIGVELAQLFILNGTSATDDVLLNVSGAVIGTLLAVAFVRRPSRPRPGG